MAGQTDSRSKRTQGGHRDVDGEDADTSDAQECGQGCEADGVEGEAQYHVWQEEGQFNGCRNDEGGVHDGVGGRVDDVRDGGKHYADVGGDGRCDARGGEEPDARLRNEPPQYGAEADNGVLLAVEDAEEDELVDGSGRGPRQE